MACLRQFSSLRRHSVRRTTALPSTPKGYYLLNPTMVYASKSGYSIGYDESTNIDDLFEDWCWRFDKRYSSEEEKLYSREVFGNNVATMLRLKEKKPSLKLGCNGLMDIPPGKRAHVRMLKPKRVVKDDARREFEEKILRKWEETFKGQWRFVPSYALAPCKNLHISRGTYTY